MRRWLSALSWNQPTWNIFWRHSSPPTALLLPPFTCSKSTTTNTTPIIQICFFSSKYRYMQSLALQPCLDHASTEVLGLEPSSPPQTAKLWAEWAPEQGPACESLQIGGIHPAGPGFSHHWYGHHLHRRIPKNLKVTNPLIQRESQQQTAPKQGHQLSLGLRGLVGRTGEHERIEGCHQECHLWLDWDTLKL